MPDTTTLAKWIALAGLVLLVIAGAVWLLGRLGLSLGRLPGDIRLERDGFTFYFPLATSILLSLGLTLLINLLARLFKR